MMDLIERQAAIEAVRELYIQSPKISNDIAYDTAIDQAHDALANLPSAQPERKNGKWVNCYTDGFGNMCKCSECGAMIDIQEKFRSFFCYHCGADMREDVLPSAQPNLPIKEKCAFCPHCNNCDVNDDLSIQPCVDTISRQAAIDACIRVREYRAYDEIEEIKALPSAQPIIRCKDCKHRIEHKQYGDLGESAYTCEGNMVGWILPDDFCSHAERKTYE